MNAKNKTFEQNKKCFSTLKNLPETGEYYAKIKFDNYYNLLTTVKNQITNAKELLYSIGNDTSTEKNVFAVYELLNIVSQLLPIDEMEFLDEIIKD
ncbi:hypothetical protein SL053_000072 [Flavobacterium psychrophilum]|nr:hypothetical protein [Flavobacterium psychrophilum]